MYDWPHCMCSYKQELVWFVLAMHVCMFLIFVVIQTARSEQR